MAKREQVIREFNDVVGVLTRKGADASARPRLLARLAHIGGTATGGYFTGSAEIVGTPDYLLGTGLTRCVLAWQVDNRQSNAAYIESDVEIIVTRRSLAFVATTQTRPSYPQ